MNSTTKSFALAALAVVTASMTCACAESEAGSQAASSSSTMNNAQAARQSGTSSTSQNTSQSSNQQTSQASSSNNTMGTSEAVGAPVGTNRPGGAGKKSRTAPATSTNSVRSQSTPSTRTAHSVTRSYSWRRKPHAKRSYSSAYMQRTIHQAAATR